MIQPDKSRRERWHGAYLLMFTHSTGGMFQHQRHIDSSFFMVMCVVISADERCQEMDGGPRMMHGWQELLGHVDNGINFAQHTQSLY